MNLFRDGGRRIRYTEIFKPIFVASLTFIISVVRELISNNLFPFLKLWKSFCECLQTVFLSRQTCHQQNENETLIIYSWMWLVRFIWRWALSASQWQLYRVVVPYFRADPLRFSSRPLRMNDCGFTQCGFEYPPKWCTSSAVLVVCCHVKLLPPRRTFCVHRGMHILQCHFYSKPHNQSACVFSCKPPPALLAEWRSSLACHCGNTDEQHRSWPWRRNSPPAPAGNKPPRHLDHDCSALPLSYPRFPTLDIIQTSKWW